MNEEELKNLYPDSYNIEAIEEVLTIKENIF